MYVKKAVWTAGAVWLSCSLSAAQVWHVDGKRTEDGTGTAEAPFRTIQEAVDAAASGDTVYVAAGIYATGSRTDAFTATMENRVYIDKPLTLIGEDRHRTFILGQKASVPADNKGLGLGTDAVRCLGIKASDVVVSNFTLTGGATRIPAANDDPNGNGGGVYVATQMKNVYLVDCIVSNNVAYRAGAVRYGRDETAYHLTLVRSWVHANRAANIDAVSRACRFVHCLITHHGGSGGLFSGGGTFVNCTFAGNYARSCGASIRAKNCLFADYWYKEDGGSTVYEHCAFPVAQEMVVSPAETNDACLFNAGCDQFISPVNHDYRLHPAANVLAAGDRTHLDDFDLPEAYKYTDFFGDPVDRTTTVCALGCGQMPVTPVGGTLRFASIPAVTSVSPSGASFDNQVSFNGNVFYRSELAYSRAVTWPETVKVTVTPGTWQAVHSFSASGADTVYRFPYLDETWDVTPPQAADAVLTLKPVVASVAFHVDQTSAVTPADGSAEAPYTDLQTAIDAVPAGATGVIYSHGGTFATGTKKFQNLPCRIGFTGKNIRITGVTGPEQNVIVGAAAAGTATDAWPWGMGDDAVRCAYFDGYSALQGFTLTGGRTACGEGSGNGRRGAGAFIGTGSWITDCIITNNIGCQGVAINGAESATTPQAFAARCYIAQNRGFTYSTQVEGGSGMVRSLRGGAFLVLVNNNGVLDGSYEKQFFYHCSFHSMYAGNVLHGVSTLYDCAVSVPNGTMVNTAAYGGVADYDAGGVTSSTCVTADPLFASAGTGDLRPAAVSPVKTAGTFETSDLYHVFIGRDFYGHPFRILDGKPLCGAVHAFAPTLVTAGEGMTPAGTNVYTQAGASVTLTAVKTRPFLGFEVNGVTQAVNGTSMTLTVPAVGADAEPTVVRPCYDTNWYVDERRGADGNTGTAASPKASLAAALTYAQAGDVVHVAPGEYKDGDMIHATKVFSGTGTIALRARAVVPAGVELRAQGTAEETFIVGGSDPKAEASLSGCGANACRGVFLGSNAKLTGFTVTGGRTAAVSGENSDNVNGGGILARDATAVVTDCIVSNNVAQRGGGGFFGTYNRCRFLGNAIVLGGNGPAVRGDGGKEAVLRNCLIAGNEGWSTVYFGKLDNCTVAADNTQNGNTLGMTVFNACSPVNNTLILGTKGFSGNVRLNRCVFSEGTAVYAAKTDTVIVNADCEIAEEDALAVDEQYAPVIGVNPAVDAADSSLCEAGTLGDRDVYGHPRAVNGLRRDVGAVEAVWLPVYAKALGSAVTAVTAASPDVVLTETGVAVPAGASLTATVGKAGSDGETFEADVSVAADAACSLAWNGAEPFETLTAGDGQKVRFVLPAAASPLTVAAYDGTSVLGGIRAEKKFLIFVR